MYTTWGTNCSARVMDEEPNLYIDSDVVGALSGS